MHLQCKKWVSRDKERIDSLQPQKSKSWLYWPERWVPPKLGGSILERTEERALQGLRGSFYKWGWRRESLASPEPETAFKKLKINKLPGARKVRLPLFAASGFQDRRWSLAAYLADFLKPWACFTALVWGGGFIEHLTMEGSDIWSNTTPGASVKVIRCDWHFNW